LSENPTIDSIRPGLNALELTMIIISPQQKKLFEYAETSPLLDQPLKSQLKEFNRLLNDRQQYKKQQIAAVVAQAKQGQEPQKSESFCSYCATSSKENPMLKLKECSGCHNVRYCGKECQTADWKQGHKKCCK
jgi:NADH pyrophosphatase NudC (nudix superfamily)